MTFGLLVRKELSFEWRARELIVPLLLTALLVVAVGLVAFHDVEARDLVAAGTVWLALSFAASVGLARAFLGERDRGTLDTLLALPVPRGLVFLSKMTASAVTLALVAAIVGTVWAVGAGASFSPNWSGLVALLGLGVVGLAATGTMLAFLASESRARESLLPVLSLPILIPVILSGLHGTADALSGAPFEAWRAELLVLAGYDVAFVATSWLLFEMVVGP